MKPTIKIQVESVPPLSMEDRFTFFLKEMCELADQGAELELLKRVAVQHSDFSFYFHKTNIHLLDPQTGKRLVLVTWQNPNQQQPPSI